MPDNTDNPDDSSEDLESTESTAEDEALDWDDIVATNLEMIRQFNEEAQEKDEPEPDKIEFEPPELDYIELMGDMIGDDEVGGFFKVMLIVVALFLASIVFLIGFWVWVGLSDAPFAGQIRTWIQTFWPLLVFVVLQGQPLGFAGKVFSLLQRKLDHKYPDNMDVHSGHWLTNRLSELGMEHDVEVSGVAEEFFRAVDAYDPSRDIVFLSDVTYHKNDPTFWAIAAHELGHAIVHRKHKIWSAFGMKSRYVFRQCMFIFPIWIVINSFYGAPIGNTLILGALIAGLVSGTIVVLDEAWASHHALRLMDDDDRVHKETLKDIALLLGSALSTYAAGVFVILVVLALWSPLSALLLTASFDVGQPLEGNVLGLAAAMSTMLVGFLGHSIWKVFSTEKATGMPDLDPSGVSFLVAYALLATIVEIVLFSLCWNVVGSYLFIIAAFLYAIRLSFVLRFLVAPASVVVTLLVQALAKVVVSAPEKPVEPAPVTPETQSIPRKSLFDPSKITTWTRATASWTRLTSFPFIILWWMSL